MAPRLSARFSCGVQVLEEAHTYGIELVNTPFLRFSVGVSLLLCHDIPFGGSRWLGVVAPKPTDLGSDYIFKIAIVMAPTSCVLCAFSCYRRTGGPCSHYKCDVDFPSVSGQICAKLFRTQWKLTKIQGD